MSDVDLASQAWARTEALRVVVKSMARYLPDEARLNTVELLQVAAKAADTMKPDTQSTEHTSGYAQKKDLLHALSAEFRELAREIEEVAAQSEHPHP